MLDGGEQALPLNSDRDPLRIAKSTWFVTIKSRHKSTEIHREVRGVDREAHARTADTFIIKSMSITGNLPLRSNSSDTLNLSFK